jgi:enterobactin synthetase component F
MISQEHLVSDRSLFDSTLLDLPQNTHATSGPTLREMPLVAAQAGIWMADQLSPHANAYAVAHSIELNGPLDSARLLQAIDLGLAEVDTLHLDFAEREGLVVQWLDPQRRLPAAQLHDLRTAPDPVAAAQALMRSDLQGDHRVTGSPGGAGCRNAIIRVADQRWFWYQRYHHLVIDGYSFAALSRRIAELYTRLCHDEPLGTSPFTPFKAVVEEYQAYQQSAVRQRDAEFWKARGAQLPPPATLAPMPLAGQIPATRLLRERVTLDPQIFARLVQIGREQQLNAADLALALVAVWLGRLSGQPHFTAGFIFMRRLGSSAVSAAGAVINVLPMAIELVAGQTLAALARQIARELKSLRRHQRYDAEQIQRDLGRVGEGEPLYGPVINLKLFDFQLDFNGLTGIQHELASGPVRDMEIALYLSAHGELSIDLLANAERYEAAGLARLARRLPLLLERLTATPELAIDAVDLLDLQDRVLLARANATARPLTNDTLASLLQRQARRSPEAAALSDDTHRLNYRQVREQVEALAQQLRALGAGHGDIVAVALPRSVRLSLALMAIVEIGAAYLPLDTGYPDERLAMMLEDAAPRLLLVTREQAARFSQAPQCPHWCYDELLDLASLPSGRLDLSPPRPADPAYVIFTSGSTGRPKGVVIGHQAIVNRLLWMQDQYPLDATDVVLQKTPSSFDVSVWEFFWPLIVGARLHMAPPDSHRDPQALQQLFARERITTTHFVPSMLAAFIGSLVEPAAVAACTSLRQVFCSGEALPVELARRWQRRTGVPLHNLYGPTEAAVDVSAYPAHGESLEQLSGTSVPIGYPVWNTGLRILDAAMRLTPPGVAGELYLTGVQLAQGYLGQPELTASRFLIDPEDGERMYRTGDIARWLDNGAVEYLGRSDDQLKIRGQRIELGEIDHALLALPGVAEAVSHARVLGEANAADGDARQLLGYLVAQENSVLDLAGLRQILLQRLPAHMVPVALVQLPALPLSASGKLERKALPLPSIPCQPAGRAPEPGLESRIAEGFCEVLECASVQAEDDFFALGGHSLMAMRLAALLRRDLQRPVSVGQVMIASSVARLAGLLAQEHDEAAAQQAGMTPVLTLREGQGPKLFCFHPASGFAWQFSVLQRYIDPRWGLVGIQSPRPGGPLQSAGHLDDVCAAHLRLVREVQPRGPYHFIGYSLGGTLAQGIAARLQDQGEKVAFLGLLDTYPPETQNWDERLGQNVLDPQVLAEVDRERERFLAAQRNVQGAAMGEGSTALFEMIEANYADSVRLLATARSARLRGEATLFVAERTLPEGMDVRRTWSRFVERLNVERLDCAHVDIISPASLGVLGPMINRLLKGL